MKQETRIRNLKKNLIKKAISKGGIYENFGQNEYRKLKDEYGDNELTSSFFNWTLNVDDRTLKRLEKWVRL